MKAVIGAAAPPKGHQEDRPLPPAGGGSWARNETTAAGRRLRVSAGEVAGGITPRPTLSDTLRPSGAVLINAMSQRVDDPRFGPIRFDEDEESWCFDAAIEARQVRFFVGGADAPDEQLLRRAGEIRDGFAYFSRRVREFLQDEAAKRPDLAPEIEQLEIAAICLFWPERPGNGMIYFYGRDTHRVWRCDYLNCALSSLGFDS